MIISWLNFGPYLDLFYFYIRHPLSSPFNCAVHLLILSIEFMRHLQMPKTSVHDEGYPIILFPKTRLSSP